MINVFINSILAGVAGAECARMRNEAMLSLGQSSNDLSGDNHFTRQNRTAINAEARLGTLADITERHVVAAQRAAKALREAEKGPGAGDVIALDEAAARRDVIAYQPADHRESIGKLVYIAAYLIARRERLEEREMATVMEMAAPFG
ncbi:MAG: hypothetical protein E5W88_05940 [Mesorhizobium sp.]|nr:MAG: hypothetical protein E5W88_05940 [Mesorhizobium sp.]